MKFPISQVLCLLGLATATLADSAPNATQAAVSSMYIPDINSTFAINLPDNSDDVNFFIQAPVWMSWFSVGFGSTMAHSLMLIVYGASDHSHITVSPRLATGDAEPPFYDSATITQTQQSAINNGFYVVAGTCKGCRSWSGGSLKVSANTTFIFAAGPSSDPLASDSLTAPLRRHIGYGSFTMNLDQATGSGSPDELFGIDPTATTGASMMGTVIQDHDNKPIIHGILMAIATLFIAPIDIIIAGALRSWPILHMLTSSTVMIFILAGFGIGVSMSGQFLSTQRFDSAHQVLGILSLALLFVICGVGIVQRIVTGSAARRQQAPPEKTRIFGHVHTWTGRLLWILLLINNALGLKLSNAGTYLFIGYIVLAVGAFILVCLVQFTVYVCCVKHRKEDEDAAMHLHEYYGGHAQH